MRSSARDDHNAFAFGDTNRLMEEKAVGNLPLNVELERASSSHSSTPPPTWFYRDPTGVIQGPFSNQDMFEWNERGFFRDHLHVKRSIDDDFVVLGELRKKLGANPFIHQPKAPAGVQQRPLSQSLSSSNVRQDVGGGGGSSSNLLPHMLGNVVGSSGHGSNVGLGGLPTSPLRSQGQLGQNRVSPADFLGAQSQGQSVMNPNVRRMQGDTSGSMNLPQFLANIQMKHQEASGNWKAPGMGVPSASSSGNVPGGLGLSLDDRLSSSGSSTSNMLSEQLHQQSSSTAGLSFLQGLQGSNSAVAQHLQQQQMHHGLGQQFQHKQPVATPVQQLLSNMLGPQHMHPGAQEPAQPQPEPPNNSLSALFQKLNMQAPQGHSLHQQTHQLSGFLDLDEKESKMGPSQFGHPHGGHSMMSQQHHQQRGPLSGLMGNVFQSSGTAGSSGLGVIGQQQQQPPSDAFQNLLYQLKQPPPTQARMQQNCPQTALLQQIEQCDPSDWMKYTTLINALELSNPAPQVDTRPYEVQSAPQMPTSEFAGNDPFAYDNLAELSLSDDTSGLPYLSDVGSGSSLQSTESPETITRFFRGFGPTDRGVQTTESLTFPTDACVGSDSPMATFADAATDTDDLPYVPVSQPNHAEEEERRRREEIEAKVKAIEEEKKRLEQERLQWEEECRRKQERLLEEERKRMEEEERLKEARRIEEERLEAERRQMAFLQQQHRELEEELKRKEAERKKREEEEMMQAAMEKKRQEEIVRRAAEAEALKQRLEEEQREKERRAQEASKMHARAQQEEMERLRLEEMARLEAEEERERASQKGGEALRNAILKNAVGGVPWGGKSPQQPGAPSLVEVQAQEEVERHQKAKQQQGQRIVSPQAAPSRSGQGSNEWAQGNAPLRWANTVQPKSDNEPKSLAEIQAEEEQKMKQVQTEKTENVSRESEKKKSGKAPRGEQKKQTKAQREKQKSAISTREDEKTKSVNSTSSSDEKTKQTQTQREKQKSVNSAREEEKTKQTQNHREKQKSANSTHEEDKSKQTQTPREKQKSVNSARDEEKTKQAQTQREKQKSVNATREDEKAKKTQTQREKQKSVNSTREEEKTKETQTQREKQKPVNAPVSRSQKEAPQPVSWASKLAAGMPPPQPQPPQPAPTPSSAVKNVVPSNFWSNAAKNAQMTQAAAQQATVAAQQKQQQQQLQAKAAQGQKKAAVQPKEIKDVKEDGGKLGKEGNKAIDDFTKWCFVALEEVEVDPSIDIATFIGFLKEVESPYEVQDYGASYLGTSKAARHFVNEFLERRSKWRNSMKTAKAPEDSMLGPAKAINPNAPGGGSQVHYHSQGGSNSNNPDAFHTVKSKAKAKKAKKMQKVDNSILGFNVTAASDRVNIGDREFVDGM